MTLKLFLIFLVRALGVLSLLLLNLLITNNMSAYEAGLFFLAFNLLFLISPISSIGLETINLRFIPTFSAKEQYDKAYGLAFFSWISVTIIGLLITTAFYFTAELVAVSLFDNKDLIQLFELTSISLALMMLLRLIGFQLQSLHKTMASVLLISISLPFGISIVSIIDSPQNAQEIMSYVPFILCVSLIAGWLYLFRIVTFSKIDWTAYKQILPVILPVWIISTLTVGMKWIGTYIVGYWSTPEEVMLFNVAQRLTSVIGFVLIIVNLIVAPKFAELYAKDNLEKLKQLALNSNVLMLSFSLPIALTLILFPEFFLSFFSKEAINAKEMLLVLVVGQMIFVSVGSTHQLLMMTGNEKAIRNSLILSFLLMIATSIILTSNIGALGTAIGLTIGRSFHSLLSAFYVHKRLGLNVFATHHVIKKIIKQIIGKLRS